MLRVPPCVPRPVSHCHGWTILDLGVFIIRSRTFKCSLDHARKSFYRGANYIVGKVGRIASEEVILQLIKSKCIPVLLYGLEGCPLTKSDLSAIDFVVNRFFMKLFKTNNIETVKSCQYYFNFQPPNLLWSERVKNLIINMSYLLVVCLQCKLSIRACK